MALCNALLEALTEFQATSLGAGNEDLAKDIADLQAKSAGSLADWEDHATSILARLYGIDLGGDGGAAPDDKGAGGDDIGVVRK
jgi:hypothetical protein